MAIVDIYNLEKEKVGEIALSDYVFGIEPNPKVFYEVIRAQLAAVRAGTHKTKTRAEVAGSTRKIYRQKGTGRARHGDSRAPIFKKGGAVFGPRPRDYSYSVPKKVKKLAVRSALSKILKENRLYVIEEFPLQSPKTRTVVDFIKRFQLSSALIVDSDNKPLYLSCRNLPNVKMFSWKGLNLFDLLKYDALVLTKRAATEIEGVYSV